MTLTIKTIICIFLLLTSSLLGSTQSLLDEANHYFNSRQNKGHLKKAIQLIQSAKKSASTKEEQFTINWQLARAYTESVDYMDIPKKEKLQFLNKAKEAAKNANNIKRDSIEGTYWNAIAIGREAELKGILKSLKSVKPIKKSMEKIIKKNPNFHRAYFVLSRLYRKAPKVISIGNPKKSLKLINKALKLDPKESRYLLEKAEVLKKLRKKDDAIKVIKTLLDLPYYSGYFKPTVDADKQKARKLLKKLTH